MPDGTQGMVTLQDLALLKRALEDHNPALRPVPRPMARASRRRRCAQNTARS